MTGSYIGRKKHWNHTTHTHTHNTHDTRTGANWTALETASERAKGQERRETDWEWEETAPGIVRELEEAMNNTGPGLESH